MVTRTKKKKKAVPVTARSLAADILMRIERDGSFADRILAVAEGQLQERRDRSFLRELVLGVLRNKARLDHSLKNCYTKDFEKLDPYIAAVLRCGVYQMRFMDSVPDFAAVNESVDIAGRHAGRGASGLVNAILRRFGREGEPPFPDDPVKSCALEFSHPEWLVRRWTDVFGIDQATEICRAGNEKHSVMLRTARHRISADELVERFSTEGFEAVPVETMPGFFSIVEATGLFTSTVFREGLFTVQDPSAAMAVKLLDPGPDDIVLDLCSAPGGKTTFCAEMMDDKGTVTAVDVNASRLGLVQESADRLGLNSIRCVEGDALSYRDKEQETFTKVLLDAPCSGTGVLGKRLDMRWRVQEEDMARLAAVQGEMLDHAAGLVAEGGTLVYSTCTLEHEENEDQILAFLERHSNFELAVDDSFADYSIDNGYRILPQMMNGSGAFAAKLRKKNG